MAFHLHCETEQGIEEWIEWCLTVHPSDVGRSDLDHVGNIIRELKDTVEDFLSQIDDCDEDHGLCDQLTFLANTVRANPNE